jgi:hypothetical protein
MPRSLKVLNNVPPPYKIQWQFTQGPHGWSETGYLNASSFPSAQSILSGLAPLRLACSPTDVKLIGVRVTDMSNPKHAVTLGIAQLSSAGVGTYVNIVVGGNQLSAQNDLCRRAKATDALFNSTYVRIHGIPQALVSGEDSFTTDAAYTTAEAAWLAAVKANYLIKEFAARNPDGSLITQTGVFDAMSSIAAAAGVFFRKTGRPISGVQRGRAKNCSSR